MINATHLMQFLNNKKKLINHYAQWGCSNYYIKHFCSGIDWRK